MLTALLHIRWLQLKREIANLGLFHTLLFGLIFCIGASLLWGWLTSWTNTSIASAAILFIVSSLHTKRKDHRFLTVSSLSPWKVYFTEYSLLSIPFVGLLLYKGFALLILPLTLGLFLLSHFKPKTAYNQPSAWWISLIPKNNFEWVSGLRSTAIYLIPLYILALGLCFFPYVSLFLLWFILVLIASFYTLGESREMVEAFNLNAQGFIRFKLNLSLKTYTLFALPVLVVYTVFHPSDWWVTCSFLLLSSILIAFFVVSKYALYRPNENLSGNQILVSLCLMSAFVPILLPLPFILTVRNYSKSKMNLTHYLDA